MATGAPTKRNSGQLELDILAYIVARPESVQVFEDRLTRVEFEYEPARHLFHLLYGLWKKHRHFPTQAEATEMLRRISEAKEWPDFYLETVLGDLQDIYSREVTEATGDMITETLIASSLQALSRQVVTIDPQDPNQELRLLGKEIESLAMLGSRSIDLGVFPFAESVLADPIALIEEAYKGDPIPTGVPRLDIRIKGGIRPGDLAVVMAATGIGKSIILTNFALHAFREGFRVIYYALDNLAGDMLERIYAATAQRDITEPKSSKRYGQEISEAIGGPSDRFLLRDLPPGSITAQDILRHVRKVSNHLYWSDIHKGVPEDKAGKVDAIFVDYGDRMKSAEKQEKHRFDLQYIFEDLCAIGQKESLVVWTATQGNREALSRETIELRHVAESYAKLWPASFVLGMSQTPGERRQGVFRLGVLKARRKESMYAVPMAIDYSTLSISDNLSADIIPLGEKGPHEIVASRNNGNYRKADAPLEGWAPASPFGGRPTPTSEGTPRG